MNARLENLSAFVLALVDQATPTPLRLAVRDMVLSLRAHPVSCPCALEAVLRPLAALAYVEPDVGPPGPRSVAKAGEVLAELERRLAELGDRGLRMDGIRIAVRDLARSD